VRPFTRKLGVAFACTALVSGVGVGSTEALAVSSGKPGTIGWKPCPEDGTAECGTLRLPIDRARPSGEKFDLAVARRKATDPNRRIGVLLINPGGPGDPGVNFALRANTYFSPDVQAKFDIIGFDPRGVGRSRPVKCSAAGNEDLFNEFVNWCDRTTSCAVHGRDVTALWDGLLARADRGEIHDPAHPERALTANEIVLTAVKDFHGPNWSELAAYISRLDAQTPASASVSPASASAEQTMSNPFAAVFCQDWRFRVKDCPELARLTAAEMRAAPHMRGAVRVHPALTGCIGWPDKANNPQHRLRITNAPKLLMLNSLHDPASVYAWAVNVHRQTRKTTVLLAYEGWGHQVYNRNDCTRGAVDGYLTELKVPRDGTRCAPVEPTAASMAGSATTPAGPRTGIPVW
jgi:hypothetical protein